MYCSHNLQLKSSPHSKPSSENSCLCQSADAVYSNFKEIRRQLEIPVKILLDDKMPEDLFDNFFTYLSSFSVTSDLCDLPLHLTAIMSRVFDFIHDAQSGVSLRDVRTECYLNVSVQLMSETYERLFAGLERQLYNLDLIFRAMKISEFTLQRLKEHRFSAECTKPLTQLYNCGQCTGYFTFKPCLFYCMNVLRGCFSDVADIHKDFRLMTKALSDVPDSILGTFQPEVFIKDSLIHFVNLVEDLKERNLKSEVSPCLSDFDMNLLEWCIVITVVDEYKWYLSSLSLTLDCVGLH